MTDKDLGFSFLFNFSFWRPMNSLNTESIQ